MVTILSVRNYRQIVLKIIRINRNNVTNNNLYVNSNVVAPTSII
ncbi:unnamed protein product [Meloidogyne enterolobii]|uniref:Uncharacterized protein n=1 Tax=Meloidogyne enterolobii TaxID=390850 RepID=A0ACB0Y774_MELEN